MDLNQIAVGQNWLAMMNANFKTISDAQPWPGSWYTGTWGDGFAGADGQAPKIFTYRLSDRVQLVLFDTQFKTTKSIATFSNTTLVNFSTAIPTPYMDIINHSVSDLMFTAAANISIGSKSITLTNGNKTLSSDHVFVSTAWIAYK